MKIRSGFVSNSSSSSFIIGVALVPESEVAKAQELCKHAGELHDITEAMGRGHRWGEGYHASRDQYEVESFNYDSVCVRGVSEFLKEHPNGKILSLCETGDEPEWNDDTDEYNYDAVDEDWFSEDQNKVADFIYELGGSVSIGGGFNG